MNGVAKVEHGVGAALHVADEDRPHRPGEVADAEIGRSDEQGHVEKLGAERVGIEVGAKGKAGGDADVLEDVADDEADDGKGSGTFRAVAQRRVQERERDQQHEVQNGEDEVRIELAQHQFDREKPDQHPEDVACEFHGERLRSRKSARPADGTLSDRPLIFAVGRRRAGKRPMARGSGRGVDATIVLM